MLDMLKHIADNLAEARSRETSRAATPTDDALCAAIGLMFPAWRILRECEEALDIPLPIISVRYDGGLHFDAMRGYRGLSMIFPPYGGAVLSTMDFHNGKMGGPRYDDDPCADHVAAAFEWVYGV